MGFIKSEPLPRQEYCKHREHNPPGMIVLPEGIHTYKCPGCGKTQRIVIVKPYNEGNSRTLEFLVSRL